MKLLRITADNDQAINEFTRDVPSYVCKEGPDNEKNCRKIHYHLIMDSDLTDNGLRKQIYKYFQVKDEDKGQKFCAFTTISDLEGAKRYLSKGLENVKPEIIVNTMDIKVDDYYNAYWDIYSSLKDQGDKERKAAKSRTIEFFEFFDDKFTGASNTMSRYGLTPAKVCSLMIMWYTEKGYVMPTRWQGQQLVITCYARYSEATNKDSRLRDYYGFGDFQD